MDLGGQKWAAEGKNGRSVAQKARRTRERLCIRWMKLVIRVVGEGLWLTEVGEGEVEDEVEVVKGR